MIKPVDKLGLGPKREETKLEVGWLIKVTPPPWTSIPGSEITLTDDQYMRYKMWLTVGGLIQNVFPDLTDGEREILLTGIPDPEFRDIFE